MTMTGTGGLDRRGFLRLAAASGAAAGLSGLLTPAMAAAPALNMYAWSAAVDLVQQHLAAYTKETGEQVNYSNLPWAQYRGWDGHEIRRRGADRHVVGIRRLAAAMGRVGLDRPGRQVRLPDGLQCRGTVDFCTNSMMYKGHQYGLTYYTDYMGFLYNEEMLNKAGFDKPPASWDELVSQSLEIKKQGIADYPMMLAMARESWQIEFISALVFSHGGSLTDENGDAIMQDPKKGAVEALQWVVDGVRKHKIISPACVETGELAGLQAMEAGSHAFAVLPGYRLRELNDPTKSKVAGKVKQALMPQGPNGSHATVGWMRFHGMTAQAAADKARAENTAKLIEWFGGKSDGHYTFQKALFLDTRRGLRRQAAVRRPRSDGGLCQVRRCGHDPLAAGAGEEEGCHHPLVRRMGRPQRHRLAAGDPRQHRRRRRR